jgi:uncharacterized membrane protein
MSATGRGANIRTVVSQTVKPFIGIKPLINPALVEHAKQRRESVENRAADRITTFSGSMRFVYLHVIWFTSWIAFGVERYPYGLLTMIVSLEAIFLSTFVMISQNRADEKREVLANQQWMTIQDEDQQNTELLRLSNEMDRQNQELLALSNEILQLTKALHGAIAGHNGGGHVERSQGVTMRTRAQKLG